MEDKNVIMEILGTLFKLDFQNLKLIPIEDGMEVIDLNKLDVVIEHEWEFHGYYDKINKRMVEMPEDIRVMPPDHIVAISFPAYTELELAPDVHYVVGVTPLSESFLPIIIEENNISYKQEQMRRNAKKAKRHKP